MFSVTRYGDGSHIEGRNRLTRRCRGLAGARALRGFNCDSCRRTLTGKTYTHLFAGR
jgi:hypothetical protein